MGMDPVTIGLIGTAASGLYGAYNQSQTGNANLSSQQSQQAMVKAYVDKYLQPPGNNPYASAIMQFIGKQAPTAPTQAPYVPPTAPVPSNPAPGYNPTGGDSGTGGQTQGPTDGANLVAQYPGLTSAQAIRRNYFDNNPDATVDDFNNSNAYDQYTRAQAVQYPQAAAVSGAGGSAASAVDYSQYVAMTPAQRQSTMDAMAAKYTGGTQTAPGTVVYNPAYTMSEQNPADAKLYGYLQGLNNSSPAMYSFMTSPDYLQSMSSGQPLSQAGVTALQTAVQNSPSVDYGQQQGPTQYLQNGTYTDGTGGIIGYQGPNGMQTDPYTPGTINASGGVGAPIGADGSMYHYQPVNPFTYNPTLLGNAPQVTGAQTTGAQMTGAMIDPTGVPKITAPVVGTQGFNSGQDGLLQAMNKDLKPTTDPTLALQIQNMASGNSQFDNSDLFKALGVTDQTGIDQQVAGLHASAGSIGQRFGTAMMNNENTLRTNLQDNINTRNAGIASSSFEAAQARALSAMGLGAQVQDQTNTFNLNAANYGLNAASQAANSMFQTQSLNQNTALANAANSMSAQSSNADIIRQIMLANQASQNQAGLANQGSTNQANALNLSSTNQANLANQGVNASFLSQNASAQNAAGQFNANQASTNNQFNASQGNAYNNYMLQAMNGAGGLQTNQNNQNAQLIGLLAGLGVPSQQPSQIPGAVGDISQLLMLFPFLKGMMGGSSTTSQGTGAYYGNG